MAKGLIGNHLIKMRNSGRLAKPSMMVHATMETSTHSGPSSYDVEEAHRLSDEIDATQEKLDNWDHMEAGKQAEKSLKTHLATKKARLQEIKARLDLGEDDPLPKMKKKGQIDVSSSDSDY